MKKGDRIKLLENNHIDLYSLKGLVGTVVSVDQDGAYVYLDAFPTKIAGVYFYFHEMGFAE